MVDRALVERARRGDREAYDLLARWSARRLYLIAQRILRDPDRAEDATQEALVTIWKQLPRLRDPDRFEAWTYRVVVRASLREARRGHRLNGSVRLLPGDDPTLIGGEDRAAEHDALERAFERLSPDHRAVIVLRYLVGLPLEDIGEIVGVRKGTVASRLHYALRDLRAALEADDRPVVERGLLA